MAQWSYLLVILGAHVALRAVWGQSAEDEAVDCGTLTYSDAILNGEETNKTIMPWHAVIYKKNISTCSGTIITASHVISAARCFWDYELHEWHQLSDLSVAGGKLYFYLGNPRDVQAQFSDIENTVIPTEYDSNSTRCDVALVVLSTHFTFTLKLRPICLNFDVEFDMEQLTLGNKGVIATITSSEGLYLAKIAYAGNDTCPAGENGEEYFTADKICGLFAHESNDAWEHTIQIEAGEGLVFSEMDKGVQRYYLRGVYVGYLYINGARIRYFTHLLSFEDFIKKNIAVREHPRPRPPACKLPPQPEHGRYAVTAQPDARPGDAFGYIYLNYTCDDGYGVVGNESVSCLSGRWSEELPRCDRFCRLNSDPSVQYMCPVPGNNSSTRPCGRHVPAGTRVVPVCRAPDYYSPGVLFHMTCTDGTWNHVATCLPGFCRLKSDPSVEYMCPVPGNNSSTQPCGRHVPAGTRVVPVCRAPNYYSPRVLFHMTCTDGTWNHVATCLPECGRVTPKGHALMLDGRAAERGELPWHAGVYRKDNEAYKQVCGASIVTKTSVVSAAHCFWKNGLQPASLYAVGAGKLYRIWGDLRDVDEQRRGITEIKVPATYHGEQNNYQSDIALLVLSTPLVFEVYVQPVCLDFDVIFSKRQLQPGRLGKVAGWGNTSVKGIPSEELKVVELPYLSFNECYSQVPDTFTQYMTTDKICAGYGNGTALCRGDSGGGLAFPTEDEHGVRRYYLRGVVSTAPTSDMACNAFAITTFTQITSHENFIRDA